MLSCHHVFKSLERSSLESAMVDEYAHPVSSTNGEGGLLPCV